LDDGANIISYEEYYPYGGTSYQGVDKDIKAAAKRYRYTGKERDEENGLYYHGARYYAPWLGRWCSCDPHLQKYLFWSSYVYGICNPLNTLDSNGKDVAVIFRGGVTGGGKPIPEENAGNAGKLAQSLQDFANQNSIELNTLIIEPSYESKTSVATAKEFIEKNLSKGERLLIYGYSRGGDTAVDLAQALKESNIKVDILFTVDIAYGLLDIIPFYSPVDRNIPNNVDVNVNYFQTTRSKMLSRGDYNIPSDKLNTLVFNNYIQDNEIYKSEIFKESQKTANFVSKIRPEHGLIDEVVQSRIIEQAQSFLKSGESGKNWQAHSNLNLGELYQPPKSFIDSFIEKGGQILYELERQLMRYAYPNFYPLMYH
jgi:RHS repeat-associated protein